MCNYKRSENENLENLYTKYEGLSHLELSYLLGSLEDLERVTEEEVYLMLKARDNKLQ